MQIGVITNPNSKKNYRHPNRRRSLEQAVGAHGVVRETRSLDELPAVIAELLDAGCQHWVCDGGDGTLHWVLNSLYAAVRARTPVGQPLDIPVIVPTNGGTVDFVARKAGLRGDADSIVRRLAARLDDLGHHLVRRTIVLTAVSATVAAKVVHHHFGAVLGQHQRMLAADAPPGTGHQTHPSLTQFCHALPSRVRVALRRRG